MEFCEKCHNLICSCDDITTPELQSSIIEPVKCELCDSTKGPLLSYNTMLMCNSCYKKEREAEKELMEGAKDRVRALTDAPHDLTIEHKGAVIRIDHNSTDPNILMKDPDLSSLIQSNPELKVDTTIKVKSDIFNANTKPIIKIEAEINKDESIPPEEKAMALGKRILSDFQALRNVLFNFDQSYHKERDNKTSELRSYQTYLNDYANRISKEERDRIGLKDLSYKPLPPKAPRTPKVKKKKFNIKELKKYSDKLVALAKDKGIDIGSGVEFMLRGFCVQKDITVEEAYKIVKKGMKK